MPNLASIEQCVGCTACVSRCPKQCLSLVSDDAGFVNPKMINMEQCIGCNLCEKVCPVLNNNVVENGQTKALSAYSIDDVIRNESSSGGIFTELALTVLSNDGIVYGAAYDAEWTVRHIAVDKVEELHRLRGAKYAESILDCVFSEVEQHLNNKREVLFSGTPCQVAGLKTYLQRDYENLLCIDFVCHGIPSPLAWEKYIEERKRVDGEVEKPVVVNMRSKETGWSRYSYSFVMEYPDGKRYSSMNSDDLYMKLFCNDYISRKSCKACRFKGFSRVSDITLGDFWGIWVVDPDMDDGKGTSLVLIHSNKGEKVFHSITARVKFRGATLEDASKENPSLLQTSLEKSEREIILSEIRNGSYHKLYDLFPKEESVIFPVWKRAIRKLKKIIKNA